MTERNFETLENGCWYRTRGGGLYQVGYSPGAETWYSMHGEETWNECGDWNPNYPEHFMDLTLKIEPPVVKPLPQKRKRKVRLYQWLFQKPYDADWQTFPGHHETLTEASWVMLLPGIHYYRDSAAKGIEDCLIARIHGSDIEVEVEE